MPCAGAVYAVAWCPRGERVAAGGSDGMLVVINARTGAVDRRVPCPDDFDTKALAWRSPAEIAAAGADGRLLIVDLSGAVLRLTEGCLRTCEERLGVETCVCLSDNSSFLEV